MDAPLELRVCLALALSAYGAEICSRVLARKNIETSSLFPPGGAIPAIHVGNLILGAWIAGTAVDWLYPTRLGRQIILLLSLGILLSQTRLRHILMRVGVGGLSAEHRLGDILVSDTLISMANIFVDIALAVYIAFKRVPLTIDAQKARSTYQNGWILIFASIPSGIRMKQCILDFRRTRQKQHLANLLKYIIGNFPHALRSQVALGNLAAERWLVPALVTSASYSLWWDLVMDWRLLQISRRKAFSRPLYWGASFIDAALRFAFIFRSSSEHRVYALELLELARRGMWVIFRVEAEPYIVSAEYELPTISS